MAVQDDIKVGGITPQEFRIGAFQISHIYLGDSLVWEQ